MLRLFKNLTLLLALVWICLSGARLFWLVLPGPSVEPVDMSLADNRNVIADAVASPGKRVDVRQLAGLPFAGSSSSSGNTSALSTRSDDAVDTRLDLVLRGAVPSSNARAASAIIAEGKKQSTVHPGDTLPISVSGVSLLEVRADRVLLDNNGRTETLWIDHQARLRSQDAQSSRAEPVRANGQQPGGEAPAREIDTQLPASLSSIASITLEPVTGGAMGLKLQARGDGRLFRRMGLRDEDVVVAINDQALQDSRQALALTSQLQSGGKARLKVLRDGNPLTLELDLAALQVR